MTNSNPPLVDMSLNLSKVETVLVKTEIETPVRTSFGIMHERPTLVVRITDASGVRGYGEIWCNFPVCGAPHRQQLVETEIAPFIVGRKFSTPRECYKALHATLHILKLQTGEPGPIAQAIAGVDIAIWDMVARRAETPVYALFGSERDTVPAYASGINPVGVLDTVERSRARGHRKFKVKVGFGIETDRANVEAVAADISDGEFFLLDANQGWLPDDAAEALRWIAPFKPYWIEEPMPVDIPLEDWFALKDQTGIPIAGAENFTGRDQFEAVVEEKWLDIIQPDIAKWGGFTECSEVARNVVNSGLTYCPHSLGGGVALAASAHLLAAVGGPGLLECDVNENSFRDEVFEPPLDEGIVKLSGEPGLGVNIGVLDRQFP